MRCLTLYKNGYSRLLVINVSKHGVLSNLLKKRSLLGCQLAEYTILEFPHTASS